MTGCTNDHKATDWCIWLEPQAKHRKSIKLFIYLSLNQQTHAIHHNGNKMRIARAIQNANESMNRAFRVKQTLRKCVQWIAINTYLGLCLHNKKQSTQDDERTPIFRFVPASIMYCIANVINKLWVLRLLTFIYKHLSNGGISFTVTFDARSSLLIKSNQIGTMTNQKIETKITHKDNDRHSKHKKKNV